MYVSAGKKGRERGRESRSRGLSTRGRGTYEDDKPPVFVLVDRGTKQWCVIPAKTADESTIRLLLADRQQESLTVYTDGLRAYEPLEEDDTFDREYVVHGDGEYADEEIHVNTCEEPLLAGATVALAPSRRLKEQADAVSPNVSAPTRTLP